MTPVLDVEKLSFGYPASGLIAGGYAVKALVEVSLSVARGEVVGIVGESGSGKSTLLRTIVGLNRGYGGTIRYLGTPVDHSAGAARLAPFRAGVQMIFQDPGGSLNPFRTIRQILAAALARAPSSGGRPPDVEALLDQVGMNVTALARRPSEFSGGQLQRLAIARALACNPDVLLCDEPTSALDVSIQAQILELFAKLKVQGRAFVFVTHNLGVLGHIADRIAVMHRGRVVEFGAAHDLIRSPQQEYTATLLAASPRLKQRGMLLDHARQRLALISSARTTPT